MECVLKTCGLTKQYKRHRAVDGVDMTVCRGDIYGFVGENGSGKTTVIRLITGLIFPTEGGFELFGASDRSAAIGDARRKIGAIVESPSIYTNMSACDNLKMQCALLGLPCDERIRTALNEVGLGDLYGEKKHAGDFSLGMRQRHGIAMALLGDPQFLILDEPLNGLDPAGIVEVRELILRLNRDRGITFLISSHILSELSLVATKYGIISKGRILKEITAEQLHAECGKTTLIRADDADALLSVLQAQLPAERVLRTETGVSVTGEIDLTAVLGAILAAGVRILDINCRETGLEEYYLSLIGGAHHV